MIYPAADKLDEFGSKFSLVIVAAKRARQLKEGARKYVNTRSTNQITVALEEIAAVQIIPVLVGEPEKMPTSLPPTPVLTGLVSTSIDDDDTMLPISASGDLGAYADFDDADDELDLVAGEDGMEREMEDPVEEQPFSMIMPEDALETAGDSDVDDEDDVEDSDDEGPDEAD